MAEHEKVKGKDLGFGKDKRKYHPLMVKLVQQEFSADERSLYNELYSGVQDRYGLERTEELMLLHNLCFNQVRALRLQRYVLENGELSTNAKTGKTTASDVGYLLNAVESQLRNDLKELAISPKERLAHRVMGKDSKQMSHFTELIAEYSVDDDEGDKTKKVSKNDILPK